MDYEEFIARVTSHIHHKGQVMVRYYGLYSNAYRVRYARWSLALSSSDHRRGRPLGALQRLGRG
jgi:hypothetical protein